MTRASGFASLNAELGWPADSDQLGDVVQVDCGYRTQWQLVAEYRTAEHSFWITAANPASYRVQDECDLLPYWRQLEQESVPISQAYEIGASSYLDELREGVTAASGVTLRHFLIVGQNTCLEIIAGSLPQVGTAPPNFQGGTGV